MVSEPDFKELQSDLIGTRSLLVYSFSENKKEAVPFKAAMLILI